MTGKFSFRKNFSNSTLFITGSWNATYPLNINSD